MRVDEGGVERAVDQLRPLEQRPEQRDVHRDAVDVELGQRAPRPHGGLRDRAGGDDHLREQRVVAGADGEPGVAVGVDTYPAPARGLEPDERAGPARHRAVGRDGLGVDPHLQRGAPRRGGGGEAEVGEGLAVDHPQTGLDQVEAGRLLGDGVLDLDARVHLEEGRLPVGHEELDRRQPGVGADQARRRVVQGGTDVVGQRRRRRDLDELLTAPLRRAVAVAEHHGAPTVAEHLDLDVSCVREQLLDVDGVVAERRAGLGGAQAHRRLEGRRVGDRAHPPPASPGQRLDHHRAAGTERVQERPGRREVGGSLGAGEHRDPELSSALPGAGLVPEQRQRLRVRTDEGDPPVRARPGQRRVLGEEAVARVQGVAAGAHGGPDDLVDVEVGRGADPGEPDGLVGADDVRAVGVVVGVHRDGRDAERRGGAEDPDRDLGPVGDEELHRSRRSARAGARSCAPGRGRGSSARRGAGARSARVP